MKKADLEKAKDLESDICNIDKVLSEHKKRHWIKIIFNKGVRVICPYYEELFYSVRFQKELAEWLEKKKEQYQKELDDI